MLWKKLQNDKTEGVHGVMQKCYNMNVLCLYNDGISTLARIWRLRLCLVIRRIIVPLCSTKNNKILCKNCRSINLLSVLEKCAAEIWLKWYNEQNLGSIAKVYAVQWGGRSDLAWEKCGCEVYYTFIKLEKVHGKVKWFELQTILSEYGAGDWTLNMFRVVCPGNKTLMQILKYVLLSEWRSLKNQRQVWKGI